MRVRTVDKLLLLHQALADENLLKVDVTVLAILIEATNKKFGYAWASVPAIADVAGISERYARQVIRKLESFGYVRVELGGKGPKSTSRYFVNLQGGTGSSPLAMRRWKPKGELDGDKGELAVPEGGTSSSANTSYISLLHRNLPFDHGTAHSRAALLEKEICGQTEDQLVARTLRRLEAIQADRPFTDDEIEWLEEIAESYDGTSGDPLGGWAKRLLNG